MKYYEIPLGNSLNQNFFSDIPINGKSTRLYFKLRYNCIADYFTVDIQDKNKKDIVCNIPLLCGSNLLEQYEYLGLGNMAICSLDKENKKDPSKNNLGNYILIWYVED